MFTVISWIIIALEVIFIGFLAFMAVKKRKITLTENVWYFIPSVLILYALYATELFYSALETGAKLSIYAFINLIKVCLNVFKPEIEYADSLLLASNSVYSVAFFIGVLLALGVFITFIINVIYYFFYAKIRIRKILSSGCDILIADDDDADIYMRNYANTILLIQDYPTRDMKKVYREKGIVYFVSKLNESALISRFSKFINNGKDYNVVCIKERDYTLKLVAVFKNFVKQTASENFYLHVEFYYKNFKSINEVVSADKEFSPYINCFNKYELVARKFIQNYPVTKFVPAEFFDHEKAIVKPDKKINVLYVGYGKMASALFSASMINDKLVTENNNRLTEKFVNFYLYDKERSKDESKNKFFYNDRYFAQEYNKEEYFAPIQKNNNVEYKCCDIEHSDGAKDYQSKLTNNKDEFHNIIITLGSDVENVDTAIKTVLYLRQHDVENYHIFIRLKAEREEYKAFFDSQKITFFGGESYILNHSIIVDEALMARAKTVNSSYEEKKKAISKWTKLSSIKKLSNVYAGLNLRLKLNLLGYDLVQNDGQNFDDKLVSELVSRLEKQTPPVDAPYQDYLYFYKDGFNSANALSYQEKLRWNAFYLDNGYALMKKTDIKVISNDQIIKDNDSKKLHACLTTVEGLDEYHQLIAKELSTISNKTIEEELVNADTYKYDYSVLDVIKTFKEDSPMVIVKRR